MGERKLDKQIRANQCSIEIDNQWNVDRSLLLKVVHKIHEQLRATYSCNLPQDRKKLRTRDPE